MKENRIVKNAVIAYDHGSPLKRNPGLHQSDHQG